MIRRPVARVGAAHAHSLAEVGGSTIAHAPACGEILRSRADLQHTRAVLGYAPSVELDEGLTETLAWFRS